jgi:FkbM family methyltransferase
LYIEQQDILYPNPYKDWSQDASVSFYPEVPGEYRMVIKWRDRKRKRENIEDLNFKVIVEKDLDPGSGARYVSINNRTTLLLPSYWEAMQVAGHEHSIYSGIEKVIKPGQVAYDIGASLGYYAIPMSRRVGRRGQVICFEANPVNVYFLRTNLILNGIDNAKVFPLAISDFNGTMKFSINYGNLSVGLLEASYLYSGKAGHQIQVQCEKLDDILIEFVPPPPNLIKMDIEGGEAAALVGMEQTLKNFKPIIILEVHGLVMARSCFDFLDHLGYSYTNPQTERSFSNSSEVVSWYPEGVQHFICKPD